MQNVLFHQQPEPYGVRTNTGCHIRRTFPLHCSSAQVQTAADNSAVAGKLNKTINSPQNRILLIQLSVNFAARYCRGLVA